MSQLRSFNSANFSLEDITVLRHFSFVTEEIKYLLDKLSSSDDDDELLCPL